MPEVQVTRELTDVEGSEHANFLTTTIDALANWARKSSLWPYPFGTACCAIEFMAVASAHYDIARFGHPKSRRPSAMRHLPWSSTR